MMRWHGALSENDISGTSSAVLKGKVHHWKPHQCSCGLCAVGTTSCTYVCTHIHHNQTITCLLHDYPVVRHSRIMPGWNRHCFILKQRREQEWRGNEMGEVLLSGPCPAHHIRLVGLQLKKLIPSPLVSCWHWSYNHWTQLICQVRAVRSKYISKNMAWHFPWL